MRIARALALAGIDSRRKCEAYILQGHVEVNGEIARDLGRQVDLEKDEIFFRGKPVQFEKFVYFILNKPKGYTTTAGDPYARKTVFELLPSTLVSKTKRPGPARIRVFPVGRLDRDSTGLLLFTNDGELAHRLIHPRFEVGKWYEVRLNRALEPQDKGKLLAGITLEEGLAKVQKLKGLSRRVLRLLIREGKKREIRRIFEKLGYEVLELSRLTFGPLTVEALPLGRGRFLAAREIEMLKKGLEPRSSESFAGARSTRLHKK